MKFRTLIRRSLRFHWRAHLGVVLGAAVGSAALIGALVVGDSVRESLREQALARVGNASVVMQTGDRTVTPELIAGMFVAQSDHWQSLLPQARKTNLHWGIANQSRMGSTVLELNAVLSRADGAFRANHVSLFGVDAGFLEMMHWPESLEDDDLWLNLNLARQLNVKLGDELILRVAKATAVNLDSAVSSKSEHFITLRLQLRGVIPAERGDLNFRGLGRPVLNAFVSRKKLDALMGNDRVNTLLLKPALRFRPFTVGERLRLGWSDWRVSGQLNPLPHIKALNQVTGGQGEFVSDRETIEVASALLRKVWTLANAQYELKVLSHPDNDWELRTVRVFVDSPLLDASLVADFNAHPILTYLALLLRTGTNATPYSMVTAAGAPWTPLDLRDDEIVVSQWLADDLKVKPGDEIAMSYFLPESGAKLEEATNTFRVRSIVPMEMPWADRTLMPDFPGIEKAESTSEWDAGFPLTYKVRPKDDDYWKQHRGTPKAFITLAAGQKMWGNRFGNLTAIRFPIPTNETTALTPTLSSKERENRSPSSSNPKTADSSAASEKPEGDQRLSPLPGGEGQGEGERQTNFVENYRAALEKKILANLKPEELGLRFEPVREQALKAAEQSQDFGGLFLGFSFFLIIAALLLMAMLFSFGLEQRAPEIGTLLALGFTPKQVRRLLLREGVILAFIGGIIGTVGGLGYARVMIHGLTTIWRDAVGESALSFHFTAQTLVIGLFASVFVSAVTIWLTLRKFVRRPARELLVGEIQTGESNVQSLKPKVIGAGALVVALALVGWTLVKGDTANAGTFFGAGALVLVAGLSFASAWLTRLSGALVSDPARGDDSSKLAGSETGAPITLASLGLRGCARRRKRSLATIAMLACGSFLIVAIGVFRLDANRGAAEKSAGTGGFALIGETTIPVVQDLNSPAGREFFALNERDLEGVKFVPFRVHEGDEASCLNLNAAQKPRLLGVKPEMLETRFDFARGVGWQALISTRLQPGERDSAETKNRLSGFSSVPAGNTGLKPGANEIEIPAIGDANSIQWAMHKKVGDTIDYVDERGQPFKVRIVGAVANSILQGQLIIDEAEFVKRFPGESGYRMFLIDAPSNTVSQVSATLSRAMQDIGLELTPAAERLAQFNAVQNTYLGTFQILGGLGLLLGSVGLGIVVLRNVLERRGELAVLMAVGFQKPTVQRLLLMENGALLGAGLTLGVVAAAVAVLPALLSPSASLPYASLALTLAAVLVNGALWTWAATRWALRGNLLEALRNE